MGIKARVPCWLFYYCIFFDDALAVVPLAFSRHPLGRSLYHWSVFSHAASCSTTGLYPKSRSALVMSNQRSMVSMVTVNGDSLNFFAHNFADETQHIGNGEHEPDGQVKLVENGWHAHGDNGLVQKAPHAIVAAVGN